MLKINRVENNEVKELLKKYEKKKESITIILGTIITIILIVGVVYFIPLLSSLFSMTALILLIFEIVIFLILGNLILDILLGILNIFR